MSAEQITEYRVPKLEYGSVKELWAACRFFHRDPRIDDQYPMSGKFVWEAGSILVWTPHIELDASEAIRLSEQQCLVMDDFPALLVLAIVYPELPITGNPVISFGSGLVANNDAISLYRNSTGRNLYLSLAIARRDVGCGYVVKRVA